MVDCGVDNRGAWNGVTRDWLAIDEALSGGEGGVFLVRDDWRAETAFGTETKSSCTRRRIGREVVVVTVSKSLAGSFTTCAFGNLNEQ